MTDFGLRIGPRATSSQEEKPMHNHKIWTRPGYHPPLRTSPKKSQIMRHSGDMALETPSVSDGNLSLLARMGLDTSSPSEDADNDNRHMSGHGPFSARNEGYIAEEPGNSTVTLGNHQVEPAFAHETATRRVSSLGDGFSNGKNSKEMDICAPHGPSERLFSPTGGSQRYPPREPCFANSGSSRRHASNTHRGDSSPIVSSAPSGLIDSTNSNTKEPDTLWSQIPLKDRIAPLVEQNLKLRLNRSSSDQDLDQGELGLDTEIVDAVLTTEVCGSIVDSLNATRSQLAEKRVVQLSQQTLQSAANEQDKNQNTNPPAVPSTPPFTSGSPPVPTSQTPLPISLLPTSTHEQALQRKSSSIHRLSVGESQQQVPSGPAADPASTTIFQQVSSTGSTTLPANAQQEAISIPLSPGFFNRAPTLPNLPDASSSDTTSHVHIEHGRGMRDRLEPMRRRSPSPNPRPYKRPRTRSPSSTRQQTTDKERDRGGESISVSPVSTPRGLQHPASISSPSHRWRMQESLDTIRRSKSPSRPRRSASPHQRRSRSPQWRDSNYPNSSYHQHPTIHRRSPSISYTRDYPSRYPAREPSDSRLSPTSHKSSHNKHSYSTSTRERYVTMYEREQRAKKAAKRDEERESDVNEPRQSVAASNRNEERQESSTSTGNRTVDDEATLPQAPGNISSPSSTLLVPSAPTASATDCSTSQREKVPENTPIPDETSRLNLENSRPKMSVDIAAREKEVSVDVDMEPSPMSIDVEVQAGAQTKEYPWKPFDDIPGIWLFRQGSSEPDVLEETFEVTKELFQKWQLESPQANVKASVSTPTSSSSGDLSEPENTLSPKLSWKLKCVPTESIDPLREKLNNSRTAKELLQELSSLQSHWPKAGQLIIELNPDHATGRNLYAYNLDSATSYMEVKDHIKVAGSNVIRFIQLGDMSKYVFVLYTAPTSEPLNSEHHGNDVSLKNLHLMLQNSRLGNGSTFMAGTVITRRL
ncbi:hypothetical protein D9756_003491 [Leucocoprinus leucothites]|uniref:Uncharacterized protein n=1 Tax=Leucocoprinus leucothites TaxID=201217 RepID=A0A8H5LJ75_9AGAR|nr:hypothetical protein D9756_003491 [Leucoagaricus leucothites]